MTEQPRSMWEVLVPTCDNEGNKFPIDHHRAWDAIIKAATGGQTLMPVARGRWIDPATGQEYREKMIPVRIVCTEEQLEEIAKITRRHYGQIAILAYEISSHVRFFTDRESDD